MTKLDPERAVRLLRAQADELESAVLAQGPGEAPPRNDEPLTETQQLQADIALIASLLADHIERCELRENFLA